ncbi:MAG TPA: DUF4843 domain-containing protein [Pedobacter sp.]|nr:DUF4843 domain-containing protein [Pedobacter sp.]
MKRIYSLLLVAISLFVIQSCKEDKLDLYKANSSIYFPGNEDIGKVTGKDAAYYSFGYVSAYVDSYVHKVVVRTTGEIKDVDRPYQVKVADTSTLVAGRDYEFVNKQFVIPAHKYTDTIFLKVKRNSEMKKKILQMGLELVANDQFVTEMNYQTVGTGASQHNKYLTRYSFSVDDIAGAPWFWDLLQTTKAKATVNYLGAYSDKKIQLMIGRFNLDVEQILKVNYFPSITTFNAWGYGMKAYLNEMQALGTPILEADGTPMKMGTSIL